MAEKNNKKFELAKKIIYIVLLVIFVPILIINLTLIIKGLVNPDCPPDIFGQMPLAVLSGSMDNGEPDCIKVNDMIFVKKADPQTFKEGDIITFKYSDEVVTHRIVAVIKGENGKIVSFQTKGDANNTSDGLIPVENVFGIYQSRIGGLGGFVIFLQTPMGMLIFAGIPILIFVCLEVISFMNAKKKTADSSVIDEQNAEIERLKAQLEQQNQQNNSQADTKNKEESLEEFKAEKDNQE